MAHVKTTGPGTKNKKRGRHDKITKEEPIKKKPRHISVTVGTLKDCLAKFDDDLPLLYSTDDEGNWFRFVNFTPSLTYIRNPMREGDWPDQKADLVAEGTPDSIQCLIIN